MAEQDIFEEFKGALQRQKLHYEAELVKQAAKLKAKQQTYEPPADYREWRGDADYREWRT